MNPQLVVNEVHVKKKETHGEEKEESRAQVTAEQDSSSTHPEEQAQKECIEILVREMLSIGFKIFCIVENTDLILDV